MPDSTSTPESQVTASSADARDQSAASADAEKMIDLSDLPDLAAGRTQFGASLEPALCRACGDHLTDVRWFRTDWQRGGALTGYAKYTLDGSTQDVVVKLPVPPAERRWLVRLQDGVNGENGADVKDVVPRVLHHGDELGGYDLAWVVMERLPHGPLGQSWGGAAFDLFVEAVGRFAKASSAFAIEGEPRHKDWKHIHQLAREHVRRNELPNEQHWQTALKKAARNLKDWIELWEGRATEDWCHGDLHPGNAMTRVEPPHGPALLFDFAGVHRGNWVEDAIYFEHLYWSRREQLEGRKLCSMIAKERKKHGLGIGEDWAKLASVQRALLAMASPVMLQHEGNASHLNAALDVLEREIG